MTSILEVNPPKQGRNSNQNKGHLGSRYTMLVFEMKNMSGGIESMDIYFHNKHRFANAMHETMKTQIKRGWWNIKRYKAME